MFFKKKKEVSLTSMLRQPMRAILLIFVIALISFTFTIRAFEALIVMRELNRLEEQYHAVGRITPTKPFHWTIDEAVELLAKSSYVDYMDSLRVIQGVMDEVYTPDIGGFNPFVNQMFVYGTLQEKEHIYYLDLLSAEHHEEVINRFPIAPYLDIYYFTFYIDTVVAGLPELVINGMQLQFAFIDYRGINSHVYEQAEIGERYFLSGQFSRNKIWLMHGGVLGKRIISFPRPTTITWDGLDSYDLMLQPLNQSEDVFLYPVGHYGYVTTPSVLERKEEELAVLKQNIHTIFLRPTVDLTVNPLATTLGQRSVHLREGRLINRTDYETANPVAVIRAEFADIRGLEIGDSLTVMMRESPLATEFYLPDSSQSFPIRGIGSRVPAPEYILRWNPTTCAIEYLGVVHFTVRWWSFGDTTDHVTLLEKATGYITDRETRFNRSRSESLPHWQEMETNIITLEIVGIYGINDKVMETGTILYNNVFIPDSIVPAEWSQEVLYRHFSFVLTSPRYEEAFYETYHPLLLELGFWLDFLESGWANFNAAVSPIRNGIITGIIAFSILSIIVFYLVISLYFIQRRKEYAIMRALGCEKTKAIRDVSLPIGLVGLMGLLIGSIPAWFFSIDRALSILVDLDVAESVNGEISEKIATIALPIGWYFIIVVLLLVIYIGFIFVTTGRLGRYAELELLQGHLRRSKTNNPLNNLLKKIINPPALKSDNKDEQGAISQDLYYHNDEVNIYLPVISVAQVQSSLRLSHLLRLVRKRLLYQKGRAILGASIATGFTIILSFIPFSIAVNMVQVDWLYENTKVYGSIMLDPAAGEAARVLRSGAHTNLIRNVLALEAESGIPIVVSYFAAAIGERAIIPSHLSDEEVRVIVERFPVEGIGTIITAFNQRNRYQEFFFDNFDIEFLAGYDDGILYQPRQDEPSILISRFAQERWNVNPGDYLNLHRINERVNYATGVSISTISPFLYRSYRIVGIFEAASGNVDVIIPLEDFHRHEMNLFHRPFEILLNPALNRAIDDSRETIGAVIAANNPPFVLFLLDNVLRDAVEPLERNIVMMNQLYPIILGLSSLIALGLTLLILLSSIREVAMIRVIGMSKARIMATLFIEKMIVIVVGLGLGALISSLMFGSMNSIGILAYILGGGLSLVVFGFIFVRMKPMELLQVKE